MIWESGPWKKELEKNYSYLAQLSKRKGPWRNITYFTFEKKIFFSAFAIRKLIESDKISTAVENINVDAIAYPRRGLRVADYLNWHHIDDLYDLSCPNNSKLTINEFCNQIIHSFIFLAVFNQKEKLAGLFISSDRQKKKWLYEFKMKSVLDVFAKVSQDAIVASYRYRTIQPEMKSVIKLNQFNATNFLKKHDKKAYKRILNASRSIPEKD